MATTTRKQELMDKISEVHDMEQMGPAWQWEACGVHGLDKCTVCGLKHHWYRNGQNSPDTDEWSDFHGNRLSLAEAARRPCD